MTRAFVVGNIAMDETFRVDDLPGEGTSIHGVRVARDLGGKGANQAIVLARAGIETALIAGIGADGLGEEIRRLITDEPVDSRLVELGSRASDLSMVFTTPSGANTIVTTNACARALEPSDIAARMNDASPGDWIVMQGNLTVETTRAVMESARSRGLNIAFNPSPVDSAFSDLLPMVGALFVNETEAMALTNVSGDASVAALHRLGAGTVVLTRGSLDTLAVIDGQTVSTQTVSVEAVDPTGAGDTFLATAIAFALRERGEVDGRALEAGARAAALTVSRPGTLTSFPSASELETILSGGH